MNKQINLNKKNTGVLFFNFGSSCAMRLTICMYTLRKYYNGNAVLLLQQNEEHTDRIKEKAEQIGIDVELVNLDRICDRNFKSVLAPKVLKISPYEASVQIDADASFRASPRPILDRCYDYGVLVSHFCDWMSNGSIMKNRISSFADVISQEDLFGSLNRRPAINCGVVGYRHGIGDDFQKEWDDLTNKTAGRFIAEEIACQCVFWKHPHYLAPSEWNASVVWGDLDSAKIIHYHGHKHTSLKRRNSRYWWAEVGWAIEDGILDFEEVKFWSQFDKNAKKVIAEQDFAHIEKAKIEFGHLRKQKELTYG